MIGKRWPRLAIGVGLRRAAVGDSAKGHVTARQTLLRRRLRQRHLGVYDTLANV